MRRGLPWVLLAMLGAAFWLAGSRYPATPPSQAGEPQGAATDISRQQDDASQALRGPTRPPDRRSPGFLPPEAFPAIARIEQGGPFPHRQDGGVFGNREGRLPRQPRGWYREYTVDTPGVPHRGARRIVTGGAPPTQWYYTDDHYDSFRRFDPAGVAR